MTDRESALQVVATWLKGQPFNNVMSVLLLAVMSGLGYVVVCVVIPAERAAIQAMSEHMENEQTEQIDRVCDAFERGLDRMHGRPVARSNSSVASKDR